jgi:hypothetical protein
LAVENQRWRRWLPYLAPAILVFVALNQIALAHFTMLTPWKGGGFGMFSTVAHRELRVYIVKEGQDDERLRVRTGRLTHRARNYPNDKSLSALATALAVGGGKSLESVVAIRVEVWHTVFEQSNTTMTYELLHDLTYEFPSQDG